MRSVMVVAAAALLSTGCNVNERLVRDRYTTLLAPEPIEKSADAEEIDRLIEEYERGRGATNYRTVFFTQERLRRLTEVNSNNEIGEKAHLYVVKIYFDVQAYHDCIRSADDFLRKYPRSAWRPEVETLRAKCEEEVTRYRTWRESLSTESI